MRKSLVDQTPILTERDMFINLAKLVGLKDPRLLTSARIHHDLTELLATHTKHEPLAPWIHQLDGVADDLCKAAIAIDAQYADMDLMIHNLREAMHRKKVSVLTTVTQLWTKDAILEAKRAVADCNAPTPATTSGE